MNGSCVFFHSKYVSSSRALVNSSMVTASIVAGVLEAGEELDEDEAAGDKPDELVCDIFAAFEKTPGNQ